MKILLKIISKTIIPYMIVVVLCVIVLVDNAITFKSDKSL